MQEVGSITFDRGSRIGADQGRNGRVYISTDPQLDGNFAVKKIAKASLANPDFYAEAKAMYSASHPHVVPVQYACQTADSICLAMPYYVKGSLTDRIKDGPLFLSEVIRVAQGILSGLSCIHSRGHLHLDIKPSNILFSDSDVPMVADFGQARKIDATGAAKAPAKMYGPGVPPELVLNQEPRIQSDIYQAGLTLYRAVNGDAFFAEQADALFGPGDINAVKSAITRGKFPDRNRFLPHVPQSMRTIIRKALNLDMTKRFATAAEFRKSLARLNPTNNWSAHFLANGEIEWRF